MEQAKLNGTIVALLQIGCLVGALAANWFAGKCSGRDGMCTRRVRWRKIKRDMENGISFGFVNIH